MAQNSSFNQLNHLKNINEGNGKQECQTYQTTAGEELDCNLQTPLMFSRCSSLGSLTGFEQHSVQDDRNSVTSEFSPKTSRPTTPPAFNQNQISDSTFKSYSSHKINGQEDISYENIYEEKKTVPCKKMTNVLFQYDVAFKKPHFLKHSVFEDDIAAFRDESSNPISTAASSLSSLTIDDDDYNDNLSSNKAGLVKKRLNPTNTFQNNHQEYYRHDPIGSTCQSMIYSEEKSFAQRNLNKDTLICEEPKPIWNLKNDHYSSDLQNISLKKDRSDFRKSELQCQVPKKDKFVNTLQDNKESFLHLKIHPKPEGNNDRSKEDLYKKYRTEKLDFKEKGVLEDCRKSIREQGHCIEENNDLNAYEEQLLDQCIRRGMAKITKQKITDIKPFCWDLNHICLTTRGMLKLHAEDIIRDRKDERNKRRISQKCLPIRYLTDSRTK